MDTSTPTPKTLNLEQIKPIKLLGNGAMGTVFLAHDHETPSSDSSFAIKVVDTTKPDSNRRAHWEVSVLSSLPTTHPFLPTLLGSFQAHNLMGWALPYCSGGDLNKLRYQQTDHVFSPSVIRFYLAEIICALAHLHTMGIAYRDLKPENVLIQASGHVTLTDFDLSSKLTGRKHIVKDSVSDPVKNNTNKMLTRIFSFGSAQVSPEIRRRSSFSGGKRSYSFVGTEEYVSPETIKGVGHAYGVDWWALGVLAYEMLYGKTPFRGKNKKETFRNIVTMKPEFVGKRTALIDLIERLLEKDPEKRLGCFRGAEEIKEHEFFHGLRWDLLTEVRPPFVPSTEDGESLTEKITSFNIIEYFEKQRQPPLSPSSPLNVVSSSDDNDDDMNISLTEF